MHFLTMLTGVMLLFFALVFRLRFRRKKLQRLQKEIERAHEEALREDAQRECYARESAKIDAMLAETRQLLTPIFERLRLEQLLREWHARGGWVTGPPPPEVFQPLPGWNHDENKPRDGN